MTINRNSSHNSSLSASFSLDPYDLLKLAGSRISAKENPMPRWAVAEEAGDPYDPLKLEVGGVKDFDHIEPNATSFAFHTWCFPFALICHWISIVFLLYGRRITTHSVDPLLTHFLGEFPGLGLALVPDVVVPQAEQRCTWSRKLEPNFCPGWGRTSDPWHLAGADVATRLSRPSPYIYIYIYIYINIYIYIQRRGLLICRAHSFPRPAEFRAEPRNLGFTAELGRGIGPRNSSFRRGI